MTADRFPQPLCPLLGRLNRTAARPGLRLRSRLPTSRSRSATKSAEPTGRPAASAERSEGQADAIAFRLDEIGKSADALDQRGHANKAVIAPRKMGLGIDRPLGVEPNVTGLCRLLIVLVWIVSTRRNFREPLAQSEPPPQEKTAARKHH